jgi:uncharacterized protein with PIN domain
MTKPRASQRYSSDEMLAIWTAFQQSQAARCPVCDGAVEVALSGDPAQPEVEEAVIHAACSRCGREGEDCPGSHSDVQAWLD